MISSISTSEEWAQFCECFQKYILYCVDIREKKLTRIEKQIFVSDKNVIYEFQTRDKSRNISHDTLHILYRFFPGKCVMDFVSSDYISNFHKNLLDIYDINTRDIKKLSALKDDLLEASLIIENRSRFFDKNAS